VRSTLIAGVFKIDQLKVLVVPFLPLALLISNEGGKSIVIGC